MSGCRPLLGTMKLQDVLVPRALAERSATEPASRRALSRWTIGSLTKGALPVGGHVHRDATFTIDLLPEIPEGLGEPS